MERQAAETEEQHAWQKEALIIGGSAGAGTAMVRSRGKEGAAVGAAVGGVGGLIYDLLTQQWPYHSRAA